MKIGTIASALLASFFVVSVASAESVGQKVGGAIDASVEYTKEKKEAVQKELEESLQDVEGKIGDLKKSAKEAKGELKKDLDSQIVSLEKDKEAVKQKLKDLKKSSGNAWTEMKDGASKALSTLKASWQKAKDKFSEKK